MPLTADQIEAEALNLPLHERARIAEALIASLDEDAEIEVAWASVIDRRVRELDSGLVKGIPAEDVFREIEDILR
jgi:putative addiction module component (TIGR02574 family)